MEVELFRRNWRGLLPAAILLSLGCVAALLLCRATAIGLWLTDDSILYVIGAEGLATGRGFTRISGGGEIKPITGFPLGYSAVLALAGLLGLDFYEAARVMNIFLFGGTVLLSGYLVYKETGSALWAGLASILLLSARLMYFIYGWLMAEALFVLLFLISLLALQRYLATKHTRWLLMAASIAGINALVRYAALAFIPALGMGILLGALPDWKKGVRQSLTFMVVASLPFAMMALANYLFAGTAVNRTSLLGDVEFRIIIRYIERLFAQLMPIQILQDLRLRYKIAILFSLLGLAPAVQAWQALRPRMAPAEQRGESHGRGALPLVIALCMAIYLPVVWLTIAPITEGGVHVDRYLIPVFTGSVVSLAISFANAVRSLRLPKWGLAALLVAWLPLIGAHTAQTEAFLHSSIPPFSEYWGTERYEEVIEVVQKFNPETPIYCNEIYRLYFLTGRYAYQIPIFYDSFKQEERQDFEIELAKFRDRMRAGAVLILFESYDRQQPRFPPRETLTQSLVPYRELETAIVYLWK